MRSGIKLAQFCLPVAKSLYIPLALSHSRPERDSFLTMSSTPAKIEAVKVNGDDKKSDGEIAKPVEKSMTVEDGSRPRPLTEIPCLHPTRDTA